ncbi:MAG: S8 family serine peptidase [Parahaliea sp.]
MKLLHRLPLMLSFSLALAACGGGGGGGSNGGNGGGVTTPAANSDPVALIDGPASAYEGSQIALDGRQSSDSDGQIVEWAWGQTFGPTVELSGANTAQASFVAPDVEVDTDLRFQLRVTDNDGALAYAGLAIRISPPAGTPRFSISGSISAAAFQMLDGDTNDANNPREDNNSIASAQPVPSPVTLGGFVGDSDPVDGEDFFAVDLLAGQSLTLLVANAYSKSSTVVPVTANDADLYLMDSDGNIIDYSIDTNIYEHIQVNQSGRYIVNVQAYSGGTNYILAIGNQVSAKGAPEPPEFVYGEAIVDYHPARPGQQLAELATEDLAWQMGMRQRPGGVGRARLLARTAQPSEQSAYGRAAAKHERIEDPKLRARWETLMQVKRLRASPGVRDASPNDRVQANATTNDPALGLQWHYPLINLPAAWDTTPGNEEVVVAVVDSGVVASHPDLQGQLVEGYDFVASVSDARDGNGIDPDPEDTGPSDPNKSGFHGTHVSGTIAAAGNNNRGVAGAAYGARVMPLRALAGDSGTSYDVDQAIRYATGLANDSGTLTARRADIINLSLGGGAYSAITQRLLRQVREAGVIVVAAAGNDASTTPQYPAAYDGVISVSAVGPQRTIAPYSNRGAYIDVAAPGGDSTLDVAGDGYPDGVLSTSAKVVDDSNSLGGRLEYGYTFAQGTSMAAPHVSAVIALMKSVNPGLTPAQVDTLLASGALTTDLGSQGRDDNYGYGLINAYAAINAALNSAGGSVNTQARLSASNQNLNFSNQYDTLDLVLDSGGATPARVLQMSASEDWLSVAGQDTDGNGLGRYTLRVDRRGLANGVYTAVLTARSSVNTLQVRVQMAVGSGAASDLGTLYVLLYHTATDTVVDQFIARPDNGRYSFRFNNAVGSEYHIYAGSDMDNDLYICDAGEACGAWLTSDSPSPVKLAGDREQLDFAAGYQILIPSVQSAETQKSGIPLLQRRPD